jgi:two-component system nitrogen regulation sensor histidine kinase NtrY
MASADDRTSKERGHGREPGGSPLLDPSERVFWVGLTFVSLSLVSALATFLILTGLTPVTPSNEVVYGVLLVNGALILAMIAILAWQVRGLWLAWRAKVAGARLHIRIVALFSIIAALPTLMLAIGATTTFSRSLDGWFNKRVREIIDNSQNVARAYVDESGQVIRTDAVNMARDIDAGADNVKDNAEALQQLLLAQAGLRDLPVAYIIDNQGIPLVFAVEDQRLPYLSPPVGVIPQAEQGQVPLMMPHNNNRVAAVVKLTKMPGRFLYVARGVNPDIVAHLRKTEQNFSDYERLRASRFGLKVAHGLMYFSPR